MFHSLVMFTSASINFRFKGIVGYIFGTADSESGIYAKVINYRFKAYSMNFSAL